MLSAVINTKNSAKTLKAALDSLQFADEIIVMDMHSSDETLKIAKESNAKTFSHPDVGYVEPARNAAIAKASHDWVFILDADEVVPKKLAEFLRVVSNGEMNETSQPDAYWLPRHNKVFGDFLNHTGWWPDYQLRFFKKGSVQWSDEIHQPPTVVGKQEHLSASTELAIQHDNYPTVEEFVSRMNRYTSVESTQPATQNKMSLSGAAAVKVFSEEFLSRFFAHKGYLDGKRGAILSLLQATYPVMTLAKVWQLKNFSEESKEDPEHIINELEKFEKALRFWIEEYRESKESGWQRILRKIRRKLPF